MNVSGGMQPTYGGDGTYAIDAELELQKSRLQMIVNRRRELSMQLGDSLYQEVRHTMALRYGREAIVGEMELCDTDRAECEARIAWLERERKAASVAAARMVRCSRCGAPMMREDRFCERCGAPAAEAGPNGAEDAGETCPNCGAPLREGDSFCMRCGTPIERADAGDGSDGDEAPEVKVCAACGEPLVEGQKFCGKCGTPVASS